MPNILPVSAVIPVLDRPRLVREAVFSAVQGSAVPQELILVLSPLESKIYPDKEAVEKILLEIKQPHLESRLLLCPRPYAASARNEGALQAKNSWIAFLDSDDLWTETKLRKQWDYLQKRPHLRACHCGEEWIKSKRKIKHPPHLRPHRGRFLQAALRGCLVSCSALLIRKDTFHSCGGFDETFEVCEDFAFFLRYLKDYPIGLVNEKLTVKRSGEWPQLSQKYHSMDFFRIQAVLKFLKKLGKTLKKEELEAAKQSLSKKMQILQTGAARRGSRAALLKYQFLEKEIEDFFS